MKAVRSRFYCGINNCGSQSACVCRIVVCLDFELLERIHWRKNERSATDEVCVVGTVQQVIVLTGTGASQIHHHILAVPTARVDTAWIRSCGRRERSQLKPVAAIQR